MLGHRIGERPLLKIGCDKCGNELVEPGGLAFGPPHTTGIEALAVKYHLCRKCWVLFQHWLFPAKS